MWPERVECIEDVCTLYFSLNKVKAVNYCGIYKTRATLSSSCLSADLVAVLSFPVVAADHFYTRDNSALQHSHLCTMVIDFSHLIVD